MGEITTSTLPQWTYSHVRDRRAQTLLARLRIGHTYLTQRFLLTRDPQPYCDDCLVPLTVRHLLVECPILTELRHRYLYRCRGRAMTPHTAHKIVGDKALHVREHINKLPAMTSHYSRANTPHRKYLESYLTIKKLYVSYMELLRQQYPGHSYMACDRVFSNIERHLRCVQNLYTPDDYIFHITVSVYVEYKVLQMTKVMFLNIGIWNAHITKHQTPGEDKVSDLTSLLCLMPDEKKAFYQGPQAGTVKHNVVLPNEDDDKVLDCDDKS
ncbi:hypothetical protein E2C01_057592 [Portunus trituberculatus]|uniref:Uncharacterized protein n=1 Tax=Portunus trituberculatus TaxID=210409 RepID=A0A5B7H3T1_PORTR|nr:hypothetical protein [Portunus trituberculatus]